MRYLVRALRFCLGATAALAGGACTVVHIQGPSPDDVAVYRKFGIVNVDLKPGVHSVIVNSSSFGVSNSFEGFTVGYHDATYAALGSADCRIVLWVRTDEQLRELNQFLNDRTNVCVVQPTSFKGEKP